MSVGEPKTDMSKIVKEISPLIPEDKPHQLMGVGDLVDVLRAVEHGIDTSVLFKKFVPSIASLISFRNVYEYLGSSIEGFYKPEDFTKILQN